MSLVEASIGTAFKAAASKIKQTYSDANSVQIVDTSFATILPRRVALAKSISNGEISSWSFHEFLLAAFNKDLGDNGWINSAEFRFCVRNTNQKRPLIIQGFHIESTVLDRDCPASFLQIPQGSVISGECHRFAVSLDTNTPVFQRYKLINYIPQYMDEANYFDFSTIDIAPSSSANINLSLISNQRSRSISNISMRYSINNKQRCIDIPLEQNISIYSLDNISHKQRFRRTWREEAPAITTESNGDIIPSDTRLCRWDNYRGTPDGS